MDLTLAKIHTESTLQYSTIKVASWNTEKGKKNINMIINQFFNF